MDTVHLSSLYPGHYINYNGEIITKEQAQALIASGVRPTLYTVSDDHIEAALYDLSRARKEGREPEDYQAEDKFTKRVLYD